MLRPSNPVFTSHRLRINMKRQIILLCRDLHGRKIAFWLLFTRKTSFYHAWSLFFPCQTIFSPKVPISLHVRCRWRRAGLSVPEYTSVARWVARNYKYNLCIITNITYIIKLSVHGCSSRATFSDWLVDAVGKCARGLLGLLVCKDPSEFRPFQVLCRLLLDPSAEVMRKKRCSSPTCSQCLNSLMYFIRHEKSQQREIYEGTHPSTHSTGITEDTFNFILKSTRHSDKTSTYNSNKEAFESKWAKHCPLLRMYNFFIHQLLFRFFRFWSITLCSGSSVRM